MLKQTCPKCGEENPSEAVTCWACYTRLQREVTMEQRISNVLRTPLVLVSASALLCSGFAMLARRFPVAASGVVGAIAMTVACVWQSAQKDEQPPAPWTPPRVTTLKSTRVGESILFDGDADAPPIARIVDTFLSYAIGDDAAEIAIEPQLRGVRIRYQINGEWRDQMKVPRYILDDLVAELKGRAGLDATQTREMQEGFLATQVDDVKQVWRVAVWPSRWGEAVVLRREDESLVYDVTQDARYLRIGRGE